MSDPHRARAGGLVRIDEVILTNDHRRECERGHLQVVRDAQAAEPGLARELTPQVIGVASRALPREERIQVLSDLLPLLTIPGQ
jgi:hypothetical protein